MKLYDIDITSKDLELSQKKVSIHADAKNLTAYSTMTDNVRFHGISYLSNGENKMKDVTIHFIEFGQDVSEDWIFLGVLSVWAIHVYYSE
jgi:hypothetical protein